MAEGRFAYCMSKLNISQISVHSEMSCHQCQVPCLISLQCDISAVSCINNEMDFCMSGPVKTDYICCGDAGKQTVLSRGAIMLNTCDGNEVITAGLHFCSSCSDCHSLLHMTPLGWKHSQGNQQELQIFSTLHSLASSIPSLTWVHHKSQPGVLHSQPNS